MAKFAHPSGAQCFPDQRTKESGSTTPGLRCSLLYYPPRYRQSFSASSGTSTLRAQLNSAGKLPCVSPIRVGVVSGTRNPRNGPTAFVGAELAKTDLPWAVSSASNVLNVISDRYMWMLTLTFTRRVARLHDEVLYHSVE